MTVIWHLKRRDIGTGFFFKTHLLKFIYKIQGNWSLPKICVLSKSLTASGFGIRDSSNFTSIVYEANVKELISSGEMNYL